MDLWNEKEEEDDDDDVGVLTAIFPCLPSQVCESLHSSKYCASYFQCWVFITFFFFS